MTDDQWQALVNHEAAKAMGEWLEGRGGLGQPIRSLTMRDLEAMAQNAIMVFIVKASRRIKEQPGEAASQTTLDAADLRPCAICSRATRGLYYTHLLLPDRYPTYAFCSMRCLEAGAAIAKRNRGMIDKSELEAKAIKAARRNFAEVLTELGLMPTFHSRSAEEIDRLIEACVDGFQDAMRREALNDDLPF